MTKTIKFQGAEMVLVGDIESGGAIAFKEDYENFRESYAHLFPSGRILRHQEQIGTVEDIEVLED